MSFVRLRIGQPYVNAVKHKENCRRRVTVRPESLSSVNIDGMLSCSHDGRTRGLTKFLTSEPFQNTKHTRIVLTKQTMKQKTKNGAKY